MQSRVGGQLLLDPTADESYHEDGAVLMAMMPTANLVSILWSLHALVMHANESCSLLCCVSGWHSFMQQNVCPVMAFSQLHRA